MPAAPVWIASPPEVHSALLSAGPGPGALLAAAGAWSSLSAQYASAAEELAAELGAVQSAAWQGPTGEAYVAGHGPYLAWLAQASANSAQAAAQHQVAAAAYSTALATMPTLPELALNHTTHGILVATNFFGINTIPIALNEADYTRMWIQAATTMSTYDAVASAALAAVPHTPVAPPVLKSANAVAANDSSSPISGYFTDMYNQVVALIEHPVETLNQILNDFATDPVGALNTWRPLIDFTIANILGWPTFLFIITIPVRIPIVIPLLVFGINEWLAAQEAEQLAVEDPAVESPAPAPADSATRPAPTHAPAAHLNPMPVGIGSGSSAAAAAAAQSGTGTLAATGAPAGAPVFGYLVQGVSRPGAGCGPSLTERSGAKSPAESVPAAAAAGRTSSRQRTRARRGQRAMRKDFADEFMDLDSGSDVPPADDGFAQSGESDRGAGPLGFAGTVGKADTARETGLTTLDGDGFGGGPTAPMVPGTWGEEPDGQHELQRVPPVR